VLQVYTEFFNSPTPQATCLTNGNAVDAQLLDFGEMKMGVGHALFLNRQSAPLNTGSVAKQWVHVNDRTFLIESIPYRSVSNQLQQLPQASNIHPGRGSVRRTAFLETQPSQKSQPPQVGAPMKLAKAEIPGKRLVMDYELLSGATFVTLQGDTTYLVSGPVNITGGLTIEGGTVVKYTNSGAGEISVNNWGLDVVCDTASYRPGVFTSMNDNSVGDQISGSTGVPTVTSTYINFTLQSTQAMVLRNLRFSYASTAIAGTIASALNGYFDWIKIWDCQFVDCTVAFDGDILCEFALLYLYNDLFSGVTVGVTATVPEGNSFSANAVNVTADHMTQLFEENFPVT
jgi:hypothetical protein